MLAKITGRIKYLRAKGREKCMKMLVEVIKKRDQLEDLVRYGARELKRMLKK